MGKKSRRQRAKDPISSFQSQFLQANALPGEGRRQTMQRFAHQFFPEGHKAFCGVAHDDDGDSELDAVQDAAPAASKPTVAEAEAECRAALEAAARPEKVIVTPDSHPRVHRALSAFVDAVVLDADDDENLRQYLRRQGKRVGSHEIIKVIKRWPRIRKYWPRLRRRVCWGCGKQYDLSEPRLWVCAGCDEARYCDEACQRAHWRAHKAECLTIWDVKAKRRQLQGESLHKLQQEFRSWYPDEG